MTRLRNMGRAGRLVAGLTVMMLAASLIAVAFTVAGPAKPAQAATCTGQERGTLSTTGASASYDYRFYCSDGWVRIKGFLSDTKCDGQRANFQLQFRYHNSWYVYRDEAVINSNGCHGYSVSYFYRSHIRRADIKICISTGSFFLGSRRCRYL